MKQALAKKKDTEEILVSLESRQRIVRKHQTKCMAMLHILTEIFKISQYFLKQIPCIGYKKSRE